MGWQPYFGPGWIAAGTIRLRIWSPRTRHAVLLLGQRRVAMRRLPDGTHVAVTNAAPGDEYRIELDGDGPFPDPWSRSQPHGVHGPSVLLPTRGARSHRPVPRRRSQATYELHLGTYSDSGTYLAAVEHFAGLVDLGIDTIQVMPLSEFAGNRNWGYDGVYPYAPTRAYGTPGDLTAMVAAAHDLGLAVIHDVVYNHFGPDGAYLHRFCPEYFTDLHATPWGQAIDYSRPQVRRTACDAARWWIEEYGFDGLRLDATHAIVDNSAQHVVGAIAAAARRGYRRAYVVAEDSRNERDLVACHRLDAVLSDDFEHSIRVAFTGERDDYFAHYEGVPDELATAINDGWIHQDEAGPRPGTGTRGLDAEAFVFGLENHDQVGNRGAGLHLAMLCSAEGYRAATTLLCFAPQRLMLFMGQEYAAATPFLYFTDHEANLGRLVTEGRRREFGHFAEYRGRPEAIPDPQDLETFARSRLRRSEIVSGAWSLELHRRLLWLRRNDPVMRHPSRADTRAWVDRGVLHVERRRGSALRHLVATLTGVKHAVALPAGRLIFDSDEVRFGGAGSQPSMREARAVIFSSRAQ